MNYSSLPGVDEQSAFNVGLFLRETVMLLGHEKIYASYTQVSFVLIASYDITLQSNVFRAHTYLNY